jgi:hypothetical protein
MNLNLTGRGASALLLLTTIYFCTVSASAFASGIKEQPKEFQPYEWTLVGIEPPERPEWVSVIPQGDTEFYFVGTSQVFDTPANARNDARENARIQVFEYYGQVIEKQATALSTVSGSTRDTLAAYVAREDEIRTFSQNVVSEVATAAYFTETYINNNNRKAGYIVYTLHRINRQKAEDEISGFAKNISERYTAAFSQLSTLRAALEGYAIIVKSLEQNPLHRIMAYYETPKGRAGLYEYARLQIIELANSVIIEAIPARTIQETETLTTRINLRSSIIPATGLLECQASIFGISGDSIPPYPFNSASDNPYILQNRNLKPGTYNVTIEILLSNLTGGIAKNITGGFTFEVTPLNVVLNTQDAIEAGIKRAVDTLAVRLQSPTETVIGAFTMTGTNIPSELSLFLTEKITHYATENQARKYKIVEGETKNRAVLNGFFTKRNDRVDVTLKLSTPDNAADGSQIFSLSLAVLEQIGLAVEPENMHKMIVLDDIIPVPVTETIHIEASFNSNTRTYKHRDELKMSVMADRDCYFKIIHIDVGNKIRMIYPNSYDKNNYLSANTARNIFETAKYYLYEPYGVENILVVASIGQFKDIEQEYSQPWKAATEEAIKRAIAGAGEARYTITILKPHEEYEYAKPQNMTATYQAIRDDAIKQGGYFEGNETSGFYIINNIRGSYRVPRETPDIIQFTSYFLDTYTGISGRGVRTRGTPFNFSFPKPNNISQAVQAVRSGIERKGGTFTGNEQQGHFKASGIAGQYSVSDMVNVTISEKPFVVPNSVIENEVKNYFGGR